MRFVVTVAKCDNRGNFVGKFEVEDVAQGTLFDRGFLQVSNEWHNRMVSLLPQGRSVRWSVMMKGEQDECNLECEELKVIDNPFSCSSKDKGQIRSRIRRLIECLQE